jgi:hypothetical protein
LENPITKNWVGGVDKVKALSSNPRTTKKKKKKKDRERRGRNTEL